MTAARELLARLNPAGMRWEPGRGGGRPGLTDSDIAGALGMVQPGLGREVLEACWWPDGAALRRTRLRDAVIALVAPEINRQQRRLAEARTEVGLAQVCLGWSGVVTADQRRTLEHAHARLASVAADCWPRSTLESLPTLARAVLAEIAGSGRCEACQGRKAVQVGTEVVRVCTACAGRGTVAMSDRKRAAAIGRDEAVFRRNWRSVYLWMLERMTAAEQAAATELARALRDDAM